MSARRLSLRMRLTAIILLPILCIAGLAGLWELNAARQTAASVFDRSLLSAALAVVNDVAISGGDALSPRTRDILADTSGGRVFYHVYAPDGVIVAGYATPPVGIPRSSTEVASPTYFDAVYLGRDVSGVRLQNRTEVDGFAGIFTTTVWQDRAVREAFVRDLVLERLVTISALVAALGLIVWFGVRIGLRPLVDLEEAISERSERDLAPIRRAVPVEVSGVVGTLNRLFQQVSQSMSAQSEFISNAAHQLRNPIAGVLSLAEAVHRAPTPEEARRRSTDLLSAAEETADLSQKLLLLERARALSPASMHEDFDVGPAVQGWVADLRKGAHVPIELSIGEDAGRLRGDPVMLREAVVNLVDNALRHGGPGLTRIDVSVERSGNSLRINVRDDGRGLAADEVDLARERFRQMSPSSGSGLGVSIVEAIATSHGGTLELHPRSPGLEAVLVLPVRD